MKNSWWILPLIAVAVGGVVWAFNVRSPESDPMAGPAPAATSDGMDDAKAKAAPAEQPKAVVDEPVFNFGQMDSYRVRQHTFKIRNEGQAPLKLAKGSTTCKCTACQVLDPVVMPGKEGRVLIEWKTMGRALRFRHGCTVFTNDATKPGIALNVEGSVQTHLGSDPEDVELPSVNPSKQTSAEIVLFSQAWEEFTLDKFVSSLPGLTWNIEPAPAEALAKHTAKAGYRLKFTLPSDMPQGTFRHTLAFEVKRAGGEVAPYELVLRGKVLRRLVVRGPEVDAQGIIRLGTLDHGKGIKKRLLMKVLDDQLDLPIRTIRVTPEFVKVKVTPYKPEGKDAGLYYLELEVPADSPPVDHVKENQGEIAMEFDHPRIPDLDLKLEFVILKP